MPPKAIQVFTPIKDEEHLQQYITSENKKLVVVDWYPSWSGPCTLMQLTYKDLALNIEDFEKRVDIICVEMEKVKGFKNEKLPRDSSSKPRFFFFQEGKIIDAIEGADSPQLHDKVTKYLPMVY